MTVFSRQPTGRSLKEDQAEGVIPARRPAYIAGRRVLPTERPPRPASLTWLSIKQNKPWTWIKNLHPSYAMGLLYTLVGQGLITTADVPFAFRVPLLFGASLPVPWALFYIPILVIAGLGLTFGERFHGGSKAYFAVAGLFVGIWSLIVQIFGVYSGVTFAVLGVGWLASSVFYSWMRHVQQTAEDIWWAWKYPIRQAAAAAAEVVQADPARMLTEAERWEDTFARVFGYSKRKVTDPATGVVTEVKTPLLRFVDRIVYESGNLTVQFRLPETGLSFRDLTQERRIEDLERVMRQAAGSIRIEKVPGADGRDTSTDVYVHLDIVDVLAQHVAMEKDHSPISVYEAFKAGRFANGEWIYLTLAEIHAYIVGVTGAGKSNLLHVIVWQLSRCYDAVIIAMDFKGGAFLRPWLQPWLDRKTRRPIFHWVAVDLAEGYRILQALLAMCKYRGKVVGRKGHGSKWKATRQSPAVFCLIDEMSEATGQHAFVRGEDREAATTSKAAAIVTRLVILGRGVGCWLILGVQRVTNDMTGSGTLTSQIRLRIGMQTTNGGDASRIFGHSNPLAARVLNRLHHDGSIMVQKGMFGSRIMPGKSMFMGDDDTLIDTCEERCLWIEAHEDDPAPEYRDRVGPAPELDPGSHKAMVPYGLDRDRWEDMSRIGWLVDPESESEDDDDDYDADLLGKTTETGGAARQSQPRSASISDDFKARRAARKAQQDGDGTEKRATAPNAAFDELAKELANDPDLADAWRVVLDGDHHGPDNSDAPNDEGSGGQDATRDASDPAGDDASTVKRGLPIVVEFCRNAGHRGVTASEIRAELIRTGVVTPQGTTQYSRVVKAAMMAANPDERIHQPGGARKRYYLYGFGTGRTQ